MAAEAAQSAAGAGGVDVSREQVEAFLRNCIDMMGSDATRKALKAPSAGRPGPKLAELQKGVWADLGVPVEAGRAAVGRIAQNFPEHAEALLALRADFAKATDAAYLQCLQDRRPKALERKAKLPRALVLEFLDACCVRLDQPDVRERLQSHVEETGSMPDSVVNTVHDEVMEDLLGFEKVHGRKCFEALGASKEFAKDREVATCYAKWRGKTSSVCLKLLLDHQKRGGTLNVEEEVENKLLELLAKEELDNMSQEDRCAVLEKNAKKVNVFRGLPVEARKRYMERLSVEEKKDLVKSEILMVTLVQARERILGQDPTKGVE